jgi:hypothetical protein
MGGEEPTVLAFGPPELSALRGHEFHANNHTLSQFA